MKAILYLFSWLCLFCDPAHGFKIVVIGDDNSTDHITYSEYVNASINFITENAPVKMDFTYIPLLDDMDKAYADSKNLISPSPEAATVPLSSVCSAVDTEDASFFISVSEKISVTNAVRTISYQTGIPAIQLQYGPWVDGRPQPSVPVPAVESNDNITLNNYTSIFGNGTANVTIIDKNEAPPPSNYITIVPPWLSILAILPEFVLKANLTETNIIKDDIYKWDSAFLGMLSNTGLNFLRRDMPTNETDIQAQLAFFKTTTIKQNLLVGGMNNLETYFVAAKAEMDANRFKWFVFSKDPRHPQCDQCTTLDMLSIQPVESTASEKSLENLAKFKDFLMKKWADNNLYQGVNQLEVSFFLDMTDIAWQTFVYQNRTDYVLQYACHNGSAISNHTGRTLNEILYELRPVGTFGEYSRFQNASYYQNVPMSFRRCVYQDASNRQCKKMGNWTINQGIHEEYGNFLQDITKIKHYRIATVIQPPFIQRSKLTGAYEGYCIDLINEIQKIVEFNYTIYEAPDKMYGTINDRNEWNGLIGQLVQGEADIALAPLSVMAERENYVDFTVPYYDLVGTTILMMRPEQDYSLFKFMTVLEGPVWGCIVGAYFFTSFLLWVFDRFSPYSYTNNKDKYKDDPEKREFTFKECLWFCMTSLTPQGGGEAPKNISGRLVAATWWLFGFIIIASYTANLAAFLTVSRLETPINSLDDLAKQYKIKYAPVRGTAAETYFRRMAEIEDKFYEIWKAMSLNESMTPQQRAQLAVWDYPVSDKFTNMWRYMQETKLPNSTEEAIKWVLKPNQGEGFAYIGDATEIRYAEMIDCKLMKVGNEFSRKPYAIAVQQYSHLKDEISSAILRLLNQRTLEALKERWWVNNPERVKCPKAEDESDGISIQNIGGVFIVILVGIALSIITLAFEYWYYKDKRQPQNGSTVQNINGQVGNANNNVTVKEANGVSMGHFNSAFAAKE